MGLRSATVCLTLIFRSDLATIKRAVHRKDAAPRSGDSAFDRIVARTKVASDIVFQ